MALALCTAPAASAALSYVQGSNVVTSGGNTGNASTTCGGGSFVIGGGAFSTGAFDQVSIEGSFPPDSTSWREYTDVATGTQSHRAYAICDEREPVMRQASRQVSAGELATVRAHCPGQKNAYAGGYYSISSARSSRPFDDGDADRVRDDGWEATFYNNNNGFDVVYAFATCGPKDTTVKAETRSLGSAQQGLVRKRCPAGTKVTGGGARIAGSGWISSLYPADGGDTDGELDDRWEAYLENLSAKKRPISAYVVCR